MAREITDIKKFVELSRRADVKSASIKSNQKVAANGKVYKETKFKIRGTKNLYTLVIADAEKAKKLVQTLPTTLEITEL